MRLLGLAISILLFWVPVLSAAVIYVHPSGDDSFDGLYPNWTEDSHGPLLNNTRATVIANPNDTIWTYPTTYYEAITIVDAGTKWYADTNGTIWGDSSGRAVLDGGGSDAYRFSWNVQSVTISGWCVQSSTAAAYYGQSGSHYSKVEDCQAIGVSLYGGYFWGNYSQYLKSEVVSCGYGVYLRGQDGQARWNRLSDIGEAGFFVTGKWLISDNDLYRAGKNAGTRSGIQISNGAAGIRIERNRIQASGRGIAFTSETDVLVDSTIFVDTVNNPFYFGHYALHARFRNLYIYNSGSDVFYNNACTFADPGQVVFSNCLVYQNAGAAFASCTGIAYYNNLAFGNSDDEVPDLPTSWGNLTSNPNVADAATGQLWHYSPCIGAGTDGVGYQAQSDYNGAAWDTWTDVPIIGPYATTDYYGPAPVPPTPPPTVTPTAKPTAPPTRTPTPVITTPTPAPSATPTPDGYVSPTPTPTVSPSVTPTPTPDGFKSPTPSVTPTPSPSPADARYKDRSGAGRYFWLHDDDGNSWDGSFATADWQYINEALPRGRYYIGQYGDNTWTGWVYWPVGGTIMSFIHPPTPTPTPSVTPTPTATPSLTPSVTPTVTPTPPRSVIINGLEVASFANDSGCFTNAQTDWDAGIALASSLDWLGNTDWRLPATAELEMIYSYRSSLGSYTAGPYWAATEYSPTEAYNVSFVSGITSVPAKAYSSYLRVVRGAMDGTPTPSPTPTPIHIAYRDRYQGRYLRIQQRGWSDWSDVGHAEPDYQYYVPTWTWDTDIRPAWSLSGYATVYGSWITYTRPMYIDFCTPTPITPTPFPIYTPSPSPSPSPTTTPSPVSTGTPTITPSVTPTPSTSPTVTPRPRRGDIKVTIGRLDDLSTSGPVGGIAANNSYLFAGILTGVYQYIIYDRGSTWTIRDYGSLSGGGWVSGVAADSTRAAFARKSGVTIINAASPWSELTTLASEYPFSSVALDDDYIYGSQAGTGTIWVWQSDFSLQTSISQNGEATSLVSGADRLFAAGIDGRFYAYSSPEWAVDTVISVSARVPLVGVDYDSDNSTAWAASEDGGLHKWTVPGYSYSSSYDLAGSGPLRALAVGDYETVYAGGSERVLYEALKDLSDYYTDTDLSYGINCLSSDSRYIAGGTTGNKIYLWGVAVPASPTPSVTPSPVPTASPSPSISPTPSVTPTPKVITPTPAPSPSPSPSPISVLWADWTGLVARYTMDETSGTTARDVVGGYDGTLHKITASAWHSETGRHGGSVLFNGQTGEYIACGGNSAFNLQSNFTVFLWINPISTGTAADLVTRWDGWGYGGYRFLRETDGSPRLYTTTSDDQYRTLKTVTSAASGSWRFVAFTYGTDHAEAWVDSAKYTGETWGYPIKSLVTALNIGAEPDTHTSRSLNGYVDEVNIFDRCLSDGELRQVWENNINAPLFVASTDTINDVEIITTRSGETDGWQFIIEQDSPE